MTSQSKILIGVQIPCYKKQVTSPGRHRINDLKHRSSGKGYIPLPCLRQRVRFTFPLPAGQVSIRISVLRGRWLTHGLGQS